MKIALFVTIFVVCTMATVVPIAIFSLEIYSLIRLCMEKLMPSIIKLSTTEIIKIID